MEYPTGPYPTKRIKKEDAKGKYTYIINRNGYAESILSRLFKNMRSNKWLRF